MLSVYVPEKTGIFQIAANEFVSYYTRMTGNKVRIVTKPAAKGDMIVFGSDAVNAYTHSKIVDKTIPQFSIVAGSDEYQIVSAEENGRTLLFFAGGRPRALLYAVYHFFEQAGCRYFWDGDIIPENKTIPLTGWNRKESPRFHYRGLRYFAHRSLKRFQAEHWDMEEWQKELDWCLKKRFNLFMLRIGMDDVFQKAFPDVVKYPENWKVPESIDRSYDDRNLFWSLEYRGELRKKILEYARERDMLHPEDLGTMTHWYSRTPYDYLNHFKPDFMPQATSGYSQQTGLVWDIRQDKNLDAYWKLTETHIKEYGSPDLFHTIGLAERRCYADKAANHQMKLYTYRRLIHKLREKYPNAPLLIGTWDFGMYWSHEEVQEFIRELDPAKSIIFDYTSENHRETNVFTQWGLVGKFPWIFGLFHAYEPQSDIRGHYDVTERRLKIAREDDMCKGMVLWPECAHTDTLMLEYLGANTWNPCDSNLKIAEFLDKFTSDRYITQKAEMKAIWNKFLPIIKMRGFAGAPSDYAAMRCEYAFQLFYLGEVSENIKIGTTDLAYLSSFERYLNTFKAEFESMPGLLRDLAKVKLADDFLKRDVIDIARSCAGRLLHSAFYKLNVLFNRWYRKDPAVTTEHIQSLLACIKRLYECLSDILEAHEDYSMYQSLLDLQRKHECNPDFEYTLKGNGENNYCRSYVYEMVKPVYLNEFKITAKSILRHLAAKDRSKYSVSEKDCSQARKVVDSFYATPLADMAPDNRKALKKLPSVLRALADECDAFNRDEIRQDAINELKKFVKI